MTDLWQRLRERKGIDEELRAEIETVFGKRGKSAADAVCTGRVKQYRDFIVVEGRTAAYVVEDEFCTCNDFLFRKRACWHLLAVRIARETGGFVTVDGWYQETMNRP